MSDVCKNCWRWRKYKDRCWYHWEGKKECFKFLEHENADEKYLTVDESLDIY